MPWFSKVVGAATEETIHKLLAGLKLFEFPDDSMAPHFPKGTHVAIRTVCCDRGAKVGKVYVATRLVNRVESVIGVGRAAFVDRLLSTRGYGCEITLHRDSDGAAVLTDFRLPYIGKHFLYSVEFYGSLPAEL